MASEQGPVSSAPPALSSNIPAPILSIQGSVGSSIDSSIPRSLKRGRAEQSNNTSSLDNISASSLTGSPLSKAARFGGSFSPRFSPAPLTGAAALEDERRRREELKRVQTSATSENPSHKALSSLIAEGMSKLQDAPVATTALNEGLSTVANSIIIPSESHFEEKAEISPASVTSLASLGSLVQTATASTTAVASPTAMVGPGEDSRGAAMHFEPNPISEERSSNKALSFPGNVLSQPDSRAPPRGMSLPNSGLNQQLAPRSPSHKKHKCPYCETEFTRHHNLKSHLLTHSQEKPYVCQTCQMRFRRLHDLKRHTKLHTGERPHICPKCDRKFARGDALARHSKGAGGCAGRRASIGSLGGDDDYDGSQAGNESMDGVMYGENDPSNEGEISEEERRFSLPSIKTQHVGPTHGVQENFVAHSRTPSTYPPAGPRQHQPSGLYPPGVEHGSGSSTSPLSANSMQSINNGHSANTTMSTIPSPGGASIFAQSGMTESPKPLSPAGLVPHQLGHDPSAINRQRSPSLTTQFQQHHFGRRPSDRSSPQMSLPSPHGPPSGPKLPGLSGLAPPESRYNMSSQITPQQQISSNGGASGQHSQVQAGLAGNPMYQPQISGPGSSQMAPHHQGSGSGDSSNNMFASDRGVWTYVESLEEKVKHLEGRLVVMENIERSHEERINQMAAELHSVRAQLNNQNRIQNPPGFGHMQQ